MKKTPLFFSAITILLTCFSMVLTAKPASAETSSFLGPSERSDVYVDTLGFILPAP